MNGKPSHRQRKPLGSILIEVTSALGVLMVLSVYFMKSAMTVTSGQRWTVVQSMTDAFMTQESALGNRLPLDDLKSANSLFPTYPNVSSAAVEIGKLPGGRSLMGTLKRTKIADSNNLSGAGGLGDANSNPASMEGWKLQ
ncbi:MAG: hypothetical protein KDL87_07085, partial [Verrucomicrobiae bacterium]|nr:hypothetical protein [Verrucomicrobiae bacterium]